MIIACQFAFEKKILPISDFVKIKKHFLDLNLPINLKKHFEKKNVRNIIKFMRIDKKNYNSKINLILISKIGKCLPARNFAEKEIAQFLNKKF